MGGNKGPKGRTPGKTGGQMPAFFPPSSPPTLVEQPDRPSPIMAPGSGLPGVEAANGAQLSRADLEALGNDLKTHFTLLLDQKLDQKLDSKLDPITTELKAVKGAIGEIAKTANAAHEMVSALELRVAETEAAEGVLKERLAWLELRARALNLKVRGIPELKDLNADLVPALTDWLASLLGVSEESAPTLVAAYRIGPLPTGRQNYSRDIIIQFLYAREWDAVLRMSRNVTQVYFHEAKVSFLLDLSSTVLLKRKMLKPITDKLKSSNVHFKWNSASDVVVVKEGKQHKASDLEAGRRMLTALGIETPSG